MTTAPSRPGRRDRGFVPVRLDLTAQDRLTPGGRRALRAAEAAALVAGGAAAVLRYGLPSLAEPAAVNLGAVVVAALATLAATLVFRYRASLTRGTFRRRNRGAIALLVAWLAGTAALAAAGPAAFGLPLDGRLAAVLVWSDLVMAARVAAEVVGTVRSLSAGRTNPALLLVGTFGVLITAGTALLLLPACRAEGAPDLPWSDRVRVAAFTATSASCVTGLIVVPTAGPEAYWSTTGHVVIFGLFQVGGLGIMTCGAFFALTTSRSLRLRESATLRELFDSDQPVNVRRMVTAILAFTFGCELAGAALLSTLWADRPLPERAWFGLFHAVSAFCNAGFDLTGRSFVGDGGRWQVWGVVAALVMAGGLGFGVLYNLTHAAAAAARRRLTGRGLRAEAFGPKVASGRPARLTVTTRLVLVTTAFLLAVGTAWNFFFEATPGGTGHGVPVGERLADAWFQSAVLRTAGFNTVDLADLRPATKLVAVGLMFVGGAPVSTAGGVKVVTLAVAVLALAAILRGRSQAEVAGRAIPDEVSKRALTVIALGGATLMTVTLLLAAIEDDGETAAGFALIDLMFEAASACGTVGVSTGITPRLEPASQFVLIAAMFLGRIGPLTLLLGLAGGRQPADYDYPEERVTLG